MAPPRPVNFAQLRHGGGGSAITVIYVVAPAQPPRMELVRKPWWQP